MSRAACALALVAALAAAGCGDDSGGDQTVPSSTDENEPVVLTEGTTEADLDVGDPVHLQVDENASIGDDWDISAPPDLSVVRVTGETYTADDPQATGSGGVRVFELQAVGTGTTSVTLRDCYRCDSTGTPSPDDAEETRTVTFALTVAGVEGPDDLPPDDGATLTADTPSATITGSEVAVVAVEGEVWNAPDADVARIVGQTEGDDGPVLVIAPVGIGETDLSIHTPDGENVALTVRVAE